MVIFILALILFVLLLYFYLSYKGPEPESITFEQPIYIECDYFISSNQKYAEVNITNVTYFSEPEGATYLERIYVDVLNYSQHYRPNYTCDFVDNDGNNDISPGDKFVISSNYPFDYIAIYYYAGVGEYTLWNTKNGSVYKPIVITPLKSIFIYDLFIYYVAPVLLVILLCCIVYSGLKLFLYKNES